jgi:hypothetical protein
MWPKHASLTAIGTTPGNEKRRGNRAFWLGHKDSNLGMSGPKPDALPLGYTPWTIVMISRDFAYVNPLQKSFRRIDADTF